MWFPGFGKVVGWRVSRLGARGESEAALRLAQRYVHWRPSDPYAWFLQAELLLREGRAEAAEGILRQGLRRHPNEPTLAYLLARVLIGLSRIAEAREVLETQLRKVPESFLPYLGLVLEAKARKAWERALSHAEEAERRIPPGLGTAKYELAVAIIAIPGGRDRAEKLLRESAREMPRWMTRYGLSHMLLGVLLETKDPKSARKHLRRARRHWRSRVPYEQFVSESRRQLAQLD